MPLQTDLLAEHYRVAQGDIASKAASQLLIAFRTLLDPNSLDKTFPAYATTATQIINAARNEAAKLGGGFYIAHRGAADVLGKIPEIAWAGPLPLQKAVTSLLVTGPVAIKRALSQGATLKQALNTAEVQSTGAAYRHASDGGRDTIFGTLHKDPHALGWARVTDGRPCYFCAMLASRGAVYKTAQTAGLAHGTHKYHDHCGCFVVPIYDTHKTWPGIGPQLQHLWASSTEGHSGQNAINAFRAAYDAAYPVGTNPSETIAKAQIVNLKKAEAQAKAAAEAAAARAAAEAAAEAEAAAKAAAEAAAEAERIAQEASGMTLPKPRPEDLKYLKGAGGTHGAAIYNDTRTGEKWIFKGQDDLLSDVDVGTAKLAKRVGMPAPDTYYYELNGKPGSIQHMLPGGEAFPDGLDPAKLSAEDIFDLQKSQVMDWLTSNHDAHWGNFVRDAEGHLVEIDKGQAFKFFGRDRLNASFHPNAVEKEPVFNTLWRAFGQDKIDLLNPAEGELHLFIKAVEDIPDDDLKAMFRPYAEHAAERGWLGTGKASGTIFPSKLPPNDVEAFLNALVDRKNHLSDDFNKLYEQQLIVREAVQAEAAKAAAAEAEAKLAAELAAKQAKLQAAKEKKWKGKPAPKPPVKPVPVMPDVPSYFDGWLTKVKARYSEFSGGKSLEASYNWPKVQQAIAGYGTPEGKAVLKALHDKGYVDDALAAEYDGVAQTIAHAKAAAETDADYLKALRSWKNKSTRQKRYLDEWREVNGVTESLRGMDAPALKHATHEEGKKWADANLPVPTGPQASAIKRYSGSSYEEWNGALRALKDPSALPKGWEDLTKKVDASMHMLPDDVIVHRGTTFKEFEFPDGSRTHSVPPPDPMKLKGTVQTQHGYWSTSVGHRSAFYSRPVQLVMRVPAGNKAAWVNPVSSFEDIEYELLLNRSTTYFIHDVYQKDGKWVVEVEVLPEGADAKAFDGLSTMPFAARP